MRVRNSKLKDAGFAFLDRYGKAHQVQIENWVLEVAPELLSLVSKELGSLESLDEEPSEELVEVSSEEPALGDEPTDSENDTKESKKTRRKG